MNPAAAPPSTEATLATVAEGAERMLALLHRQAEALDAGDAEAVERCADSLRRLASELEPLAPCLLEPDSGPRSTRRERLTALLAECRDRLAANGARVDALARHAHRALAALTGASGGTAVYGRHGVEHPLATSRYTTRA